MHDRAPIRARAAAGVSIRAIARELGISRNTVRRALDPARPDHYARPSRLAEFEGPLREVLEEWPLMPATWLAVRVGWSGSLAHFCSLVNRVRPDVLANRPETPLIRPMTW